jgi:carbonic anhydrase/acetyltransferase-like protein (isoleucine patch superfamily)
LSLSGYARYSITLSLSFTVVIGDCYIGEVILVASTAVCRGGVSIGGCSNIQEGVVLHD